MKLKKITVMLSCMVIAFGLSACSQARYATHVVKQIPLPQDPPPKSKGYFKVGSSYKIKGKRYYPAESYNLTETGTASWYGPGFHGKQTANGEIFNKHELTAAHRTLQLPSIIKVTNLGNGRSVILRVNDRGPFAHNRILDVSERAAVVLGFKDKGVAKIRLEVLADASKEVASVARSGKSTRGYEVAYNEGRQPQRQFANVVTETPIPVEKPEPVTEVVLGQEQPSVIEPTPAQNTSFETARVPSVQSEPLQGVLQNATTPASGYVQSTGRVFVQAGSFSQEANALSFSDKISQHGPSRVYLTRVDDQPYFRVRLGPYDNSAQAQQAIASLSQSGHQNAVIVTE